MQRIMVKKLKRPAAVLAILMVYCSCPRPCGNRSHGKAGDTLWKISQWYGTTVYELKRANNHWSDAI